MSTFASSFHELAVTLSPAQGIPRRRRDDPPIVAPIARVSVDRRLNGPRRSANGGFAAGILSRHVDADVVTVVLRRRVPLARPLDVHADDRRGVVLSRRRRTVAQARPGVLADTIAPPPPSWGEALAARAHHPLIGVRHLLSDCIVCGPERSDGMRVTPGPVAGRPELLAAPWLVGVRESASGTAHAAAVWAALDCPSYPAEALAARRLCLLGTMTARIDRRPRVGERIVVYSWTRSRKDRKYETSVRAVDEAGGQIAAADATWIALR
ncbi:hypothetical protein [Microbacterium hominis]|uniref:Thioesterase family protein n=1 Tax=Microbacterium hominis TaxID=162426 RepID=A0A7D4UBA4_9MICO|nr:hypothetical protein [Microbacterium hominis]QKJ19343.1 hypothetical protein HQM25_08170 [Microbacterium hominis]